MTLLPNNDLQSPHQQLLIRFHASCIRGRANLCMNLAPNFLFKPKKKAWRLEAPLGGRLAVWINHHVVLSDTTLKHAPS